MATLKIPDENQTLTDPEAIRVRLAACGIDFERCGPETPLGPDATDEEVLSAYSDKIDELKQRGGYVTADVIRVTPETPGLDAMMAKFSREHIHAEDEVRLIVDGHGLFHIHCKDSPVLAVEVEPQDLISVPRGTLHWFDLCRDRRVRAVRLFQNPEGWVPEYSDSRIDEKYERVCFGPAFIPERAVTR